MTTQPDIPRWWSPIRDHGNLAGPPKRGISDLVALALIILDLDTVRRTTIRDLCPQDCVHHETSKPTNAKVRTPINRALRRFEKNGWAHRDGLFIHVTNRDGLRSWIDQGVDITDERAAIMLGVEEAATRINERLEDGSAVSGWDTQMARQYAEVRRQELIAIERLMKATHTGHHGVRLIHKGGLL